MRIFAAAAAAVAVLISSSGSSLASEPNGSMVQLTRTTAVAALADWGHIRTSMNGKCLDADADTLPNDGTRVQLWDCNGTTQQGWNYEFVDNTRLVIHVQWSNKCLEEAPGGGNGTPIQIWGCGYWSQQLWTMYFFPADNTFMYRNELSGRWLDADNAHGGGNGTKVQIWDRMPAPNPNQHWW